ncbi:DUF1428 domain-containing protein [Pyxidicoccus sp. 3LFB2]
MSYVAGFVAAVPAANKEAYRKHAASAVALFKELGVTRMVEAWGDDVPEGKVTDFKGAVKAQPGEVIVFSWHEYPSREAAEASNQKMMSDPRMRELGATMPFDGERMIFGGFAPIIDARTAGPMGYVDGALVAVPASNKNAYQELAARQAAVIREYGATRVVEAWGDFVPDGKLTDFKRAVKATGDEQVVFCWVEWPSKAVRDAAWSKVFADPRMHPDSAPYDGGRRVHGGFMPLLDT